jgi:hypothetical protein
LLKFVERNKIDRSEFALIVDGRVIEGQSIFPIADKVPVESTILDAVGITGPKRLGLHLLANIRRYLVEHYSLELDLLDSLLSLLLDKHTHK